METLRISLLQLVDRQKKMEAEISRDIRGRVKIESLERKYYKFITGKSSLLTNPSNFNNFQLPTSKTDDLSNTVIVYLVICIENSTNAATLNPEM